MSFTRLALALLLASVLAQMGIAQEEADDDESRMRSLLDSSVGWFEFRQAGEAEPLTPHTVLRWTNNARESADGLSVIWLSSSGRPEAIAAIYPYGDLFCLEFESLSRAGFEASMQGEAFWAPESAGLEFKPIEGAPVPPNSKPARLLQMKALARKFDATMLGWNPKANQQEELRLLPRPIHRYKLTSDETILDGALFAFASGTDPEALLVIEAVKVGQSYQWQYAFARQTSGALEARLGDEAVWTARAYPPGGQITSIHRGHREPLAPLLNAVEAVEE